MPLQSDSWKNTMTTISLKMYNWAKTYFTEHLQDHISMCTSKYYPTFIPVLLASIINRENEKSVITEAKLEVPNLFSNLEL